MSWLVFCSCGGLEVGGYEDQPDWPNGTFSLIATSIILAIPHSEVAGKSNRGLDNRDLDADIGYARPYLGDYLLARKRGRNRSRRQGRLSTNRVMMTRRNRRYARNGGWGHFRSKSVRHFMAAA